MQDVTNPGPLSQNNSLNVHKNTNLTYVSATGSNNGSTSMNYVSPMR